MQLAPYCFAEPSGKGAEQFLGRISENAIAQFVSDPSYYYVVARQDKQLAGVAALRQGKHLYHFFVTEQFHKQGIGKAMWHNLQHYANAVGNQGKFTVNSSIFAVPVYERLGFKATSAPQTANGVTFVPMSL